MNGAASPLTKRQLPDPTRASHAAQRPAPATAAPVIAAVVTALELLATF
jgi:hypothetical protein